MLESKDLELLRAMMQEVVTASETRMTAKIEESIAASETRMTTKIEESIAASEARTDKKLEALEARMTTKIEDRIEDTRSTIMAYLETAIEPKITLLAEGHKALQETLAPKSRVEELEEEVAFLKPLVMSMLTDIDKLKKAQ